MSAMEDNGMLGAYCTLGGAGMGNINIHAGGVVTVGGAILGNGVNSKSSANVNGTGSILTADSIKVGGNGQGALTITDGGVVNTDTGVIGNAAGSTGIVTVDGAGSQWNLTGRLTTGVAGNGTMILTNNAVVTSRGGIVGNAADSTGTVDVSSGGLWNLVNAAGTRQDFNIGYYGTGIVNIASAGVLTAGTTTLGSFASGTGTVDVTGTGSAMNTGALRVGDYGRGTLNIRNEAQVNSIADSMIGRSPDGQGTVNVNSGGSWMITDATGAKKNLQVGASGIGILNIQAGGQVVAGVTSLGNMNTSAGTINISGAGSSMTATSMIVGSANTGVLYLSDAGTLALDGDMTIAQATGSKGTVNIGAEHGQSAADAGFITGAGKVVFGAGTGTLVFNHTVSDLSTAGGYQFSPVISGEGTLIQDAGHTVLSGDNIFSGSTLINGGILTTNKMPGINRSGLGSSAVTIDTAGTLEIKGATNGSTGNFTLRNALSGTGLISVDLTTAEDVFAFAPSVGSAFAGTVDLKNSTFALSGTNTSALTQATLVTSTGNTTTVGNGEQTIGGLTFAGGRVAFNATVPHDTVATSYVKTNHLDASGSGTVQVNIPATYVPGHATDTTSSLMTQDDANIGLELVSATTVTGSGANLALVDQTGSTITAAKQVDISHSADTVAKGTYDYRLSTAPGDGLYVNYGLTELELLANQTLTLEGTPGATGAAADQSARITGSGNLAISTTGSDVLSLSSSNDYTGDTTVLSGTLRTDADGALGNTAMLAIHSVAKADLNGTVQVAGMLAGDEDSVLDVNGGSLSLASGGYSDGILTGGGSLNVVGGVLTINGANSGFSATTDISSGAEVVIRNVQGAGSGDIFDEGTLTLDGATGTLANNISGTGHVDATNITDAIVAGDNSGFSGLFNIDDGSSLTVSEQYHLGTATVNDEGLLTVNTDSDWTLSNSVNGGGDLTKSGTGTLTLTADAVAYTGITDITAGTLALAAATPVDMASEQVNVHDGAFFTGYGSTAGDVDVMQGGTMQMTDFLVGGNLTNSGSVLLAREDGTPGNTLTVNGNYSGNNGLLAFNTELGGDDSPTDKMTVHGDTAGNTRVEVNNVGGIGAQTVNGIELVQVDGNSAGNFALTKGTVEAGAYVYTLAKGAGAAAKNWYLTSKWNGAAPVQNAPEAPVVDPAAPDALRPEAGSYISNIAAANTLFNHRLHDRLGEPQYTDALHNGEDNVTSMWMRHVGGHERSSAGDGQLKSRSNRYVLQLGGDIARWSTDGLDRWHVGVMGGYANEHSNTRSNRAGYGSEGRVSGYSAGLYGTWYQNDMDKTGMYVDSWVQYNWFDNSVTADRRERDEYKSKGLTASLEAGYTIKAGEFWGSQGTLNAWYIQPQAQVTWMGVKANAHTRHDGTRIETQGDGNIQTRLGVRTYLNSHHKMDDGKQREFQPFVEVNWIHNTEAFGVKMDDTKVSRDGARNLGEIRTGVEGKLNDRLSVWGNVGVQVGDNGYSDTQGMLGVKYSW
ncbi:autotransporter outer membrane beta-barrel domain-containing protein [Citrobacter rodentium]|uniref:autotransporter outer membrane beta-barrel domain-containing protein n=2 Tax=Citrobacter rodentium TaxID=67825 RepID=UPI0034E26C60